MSEYDADKVVNGHREEKIKPDELLTAEQAAAYLGIEARRLPMVAEQYGIGRRYRTETEPGWYYARPELDEILASAEFQSSRDKT